MSSSDKSSKKEQIAELFDDLINDELLDHVSLKVFKAHAVAAWNRANPEGIAPRTNAYIEFLKATMPSVRTAYPTLSNPECMKMIGKLWAEKKKEMSQVTTTTTTSSSSEDSAEQVTKVKIVRPKKTKGKAEPKTSV